MQKLGLGAALVGVIGITLTWPRHLVVCIRIKYVVGWLGHSTIQFTSIH